MEIRKTSGLLGCACLLALALLSGCGGSSSSNSIPSSATIYFAHSVIFNNHSTMAMGYNGFGQLGVGDLKTKDTATRVSIGPVNGVATGGDHTLAFTFTNLSSVYTWGSNYYGQLGNVVSGTTTIPTTGNTAYSATPVRLPLHSAKGNALAAGQVTDVAAGWAHSLAVVDGTVFSWGYNGYGQLGQRYQEPLLTTSNIPKQVQIDAITELTGINKVAAGGAHSLALTSDGRVYAWGDNTFGQLGTDPALPSNTYNSVPHLLLDANGVTLTGITQIAAGGSASYALQGATGKLYAWGINSTWQLGLDPAVTPTPLGYKYQPVEVTLPATPLKVSAGWDHVLVLLADHTVVGWGFNEYGQLGNNARVNKFSPVTVLIDGVTPMSNVTDIIAFGNHSLALVGSNPGIWYGWGDNGYGQLGQPISTNSIGYLLIPAAVRGF